jgi:hypothetical protein
MAQPWMPGSEGHQLRELLHLKTQKLENPETATKSRHWTVVCIAGSASLGAGGTLARFLAYLPLKRRAVGARHARAWFGKVCSGFPKRSCSIKDLKRDDDSTQSHRALGTLRLSTAVGMSPFVGAIERANRLTLRNPVARISKTRLRLAWSHLDAARVSTTNHFSECSRRSRRNFAYVRSNRLIGNESFTCARALCDLLSCQCHSRVKKLPEIGNNASLSLEPFKLSAAGVAGDKSGVNRIPAYACSCLPTLEEQAWRVSTTFNCFQRDRCGLSWSCDQHHDRIPRRRDFAFDTAGKATRHMRAAHGGERDHRTAGSAQP